MKKEYKAAGVADHAKMRAVCRRKVITLKGGNALDLCDVGYDYPKKVHSYGQHYRAFDDRVPFW